MKVSKLGKLKNRVKHGMTLVEIAVVVLILGAIITLVYSNLNFSDTMDKTAATRLRKDAREITGFLELYAERHGKMPSEEQGLIALAEKPTTGDVPENYKPIVKNKSAVLDPWKTPYVLKFDNNGDVIIISLGKDKKEGGEGKNADFNILNEEEYPADFRTK